MATTTVSPETRDMLLGAATDITKETGSFTVTELVDWTQKSETTVRAAVAELLSSGAVVKAEGRGRYQTATHHASTEAIEAALTAGEQAKVNVSDAQDGDVLELPDGNKLGVVTVGDSMAREAHDQDPANAGLGYVVYAYGANGQPLTINRGATWVLTSDEELANFKAATSLPVSGWAGDKRRAVKELRVYVAGSPMTGPSSQPVHVAQPQELKKSRATG